MIIAPLKKMWLSFDTNFSHIDSQKDNRSWVRNAKEFSDLQNSLIRYMIVTGIIDNDLRTWLLREPDLTLDSALKLGHAYEETKKYALELWRDFTQNPEIDHIYKCRISHRSRERNPNLEVIVKCKFCSRTHNKGSCPAYGKICNNCRNKGHFAKCCAEKKGIHLLNQEYSDNTAQDDSPNDCKIFFIGTINV